MGVYLIVRQEFGSYMLHLFHESLVVIVASVVLYLGHECPLTVYPYGYDIYLVGGFPSFCLPPRAYLPVAALFGQLLPEIFLQRQARVGRKIAINDILQVGVVVELYQGAVVFDETKPELQEIVAYAEAAL